MFTWLQNLLSKIPPSIEKPLWALIVAGLTLLAAKYGIPVPPAPFVNTTDTYLVVPSDPTFLGAQAAPVGKGDRAHPVLMAICRAKAARQYAGEQPRLGFTAALKLAREVPDDQIVAQMVEQKIAITGEMVSGGPLTNLLDWISTHPDQVQAIIKIILMLLPLFADNHQAMPWAPFDDIRVTSLPPFPPEWARPSYALAG